MAAEEKLMDLRVKQLEMIQALVTRMANYSASVKGYCLTLVVAIVGASVTLKCYGVLPVALMVVVVLALLDGRYLQNERRFRAKFDVVRSGDWGGMPNFDVAPVGAASHPFWEVILSWSIVWFYGTLLICIVAALVYGRFLA